LLYPTPTNCGPDALRQLKRRPIYLSLIQAPILLVLLYIYITKTPAGLQGWKQELWLYTPLIALSVVSGIFQYRWHKAWKVYLKNRNGVVCTNCAYDMREVEPDTCPECGEQFDEAAAKKRWSEYLKIYPHFK
jgi:hypothetical protein